VTARYWVAVEFGLACAAVVGAVVTWLHSRYPVAVAPIADGQPITMSVAYNPQQLLLTMLLAMLAGVLAVVGAARLRRARRGPNVPADGLN
jgi:hypothetical protein